MMDTILKVFVIFVCCAVTSAQLNEEIVINRDPKIVGGSAARRFQFPHAVALILHLTHGSSFCGGSIIHQNFILTAAHCLDNLQRIEVLAGIHNIFESVALYRAEVQVRDTRAHPNYDSHSLANDIGLVYVKRAIPLTTTMQRIALPTRAMVSNQFIGQVTTVIGWGRTSDATDNLSDVLRFVSLPIAPNQHCIDIYRWYFTSANICASGARGSSCNGDSGSSMSVTLNGQNTLIGIVSYGSLTCESGHPPVMTRITSHLDWIQQNTGMRIL